MYLFISKFVAKRCFLTKKSLKLTDCIVDTLFWILHEFRKLYIHAFLSVLFVLIVRMRINLDLVKSLIHFLHALFRFKSTSLPKIHVHVHWKPITYLRVIRFCKLSLNFAFFSDDHFSVLVWLLLMTNRIKLTRTINEHCVLFGVFFFFRG